MCCPRKPVASNVLAIAFLVLIFSVPSGHVRAQEKASDLDRERGRTMLKRIKEDEADRGKAIYGPGLQRVDAPGGKGRIGREAEARPIQIGWQ